MKTNEKTRSKGLSLILGDDLDYKVQRLQSNTENIVLLDIDSLTLNEEFKYEPDQKDVEKLAGAIQENGQITPILVRKKDGHYEVVTGEKRYFACKYLGMDKIKVVICDFSDNEVHDLYLYDLFDKNKLNLVYEAKLYKNIIENKGISQTELANRLNKSRSTISNFLRILSFDDDILNTIMTNKLTLGQVKPLVGLTSKVISLLIERIVNENLSSRDIEVLAALEKNKNKKIYLASENEKKINIINNCKSKIRGRKIELIFKDNESLKEFINKITQ